MRKYLALVGMLVLVALLVAPAFGETQQGQPIKGQSSQSSESQSGIIGGQGSSQQQMSGAGVQRGQLQNAILASELINKKVKGIQNEQLGTVENLVVDPFGNINYILLDPARGIKEQGQLIAIPWAAARPNIQDNEVAIFLSKNQLENAPSLSKNNLSQIQNPQWQQQNFSYFGAGMGMQGGYGGQGFGTQGRFGQQGYGPGMGYGGQGYGGYGQQGYGPGMQGGYGQQGYGPGMQGGYGQRGYGMQGGFDNSSSQGGY
jgi:sporulation protein YlmC with PRC-barrel domain